MYSNLFAALPLIALAPFAVDNDTSTCSSSTAAVRDSKTIVETAVAAGSFDTLVAAVKAAGLVDVLSGEGPFTVFAPTDEAFAALPEGTLASLLEPENRDTLVSILQFHVVSGAVRAAQVVKLPSANSLNGQRLSIKADEGVVTVAGARVLETDITCSNGVIHVIDKVMLPNGNDLLETAAAAGSFKTLGAAIRAAGLVEALKGEGPFTVLAPTDEAFAVLPAGTLESLLLPENKEKLASILKLHVISGRVYADQVVRLKSAPTLQGQELRIVKDEKGNVSIGGARVVRTDIDTSNGVIHVIDSVILPH